VHDTGGAQARAAVEVSKGSGGIRRGRRRLDNLIPSRLCFCSGKTRHEVFSQKIQTSKG
jgi:hypothetical protein